MKIWHVYIDDYEGPYYSSYFVSQEKAMEYYEKCKAEAKPGTIRWDWDEIETEDNPNTEDSSAVALKD